STHTYRLFGLLKSGAEGFVSVAASGEEATYTPAPHPRQRLFAEKSRKFGTPAKMRLQILESTRFIHSDFLGNPPKTPPERPFPPLHRPREKQKAGENSGFFSGNPAARQSEAVEHDPYST
ncbi:MAG: hypothetical protein HYZ18_04050, partial [Pseudogulbenkiania sp.]|nr:hypothetical protein [Pseudogulbenkiania sp.]